MPVRVLARPPFVLVLALLLAMPGLAGVPAASAAVQATTIRSLVQTTVQTMPTAPLTVSISRIVFTPGASDDAQSFPGLRLLFIEAGKLSLHASGTLAVFHSVAANQAGGTPIATATTTPVPTPTPLRSPTTDVILGPGDGAPVPIWTMHSLRNDGPDPAVVIDVRIAPDAAPGLSPNLDAEVLARAGGLTTLPIGAAAISFGQGTIAPGGVLAASETGAFQLVAAAGGGSLSGNTDGSFTNTGTAGQDIYVVAIVPVASDIPHQPPQPTTGPGSDDTPFPAARPTKYGPYTHRFWLWEPMTGTAANAQVAPGPFPVVIYLAGSGGSLSDPQTQNPWMQHLARQGYVVIAPVYDPTKVMDDVKVLVPQALAELAKPGHAAVDLSHVAVLGYSYGGPWAVLYAASAAANGLPVPGAIFVDSPCEGNPCATVPPDLTLPPGVKVIVLAFAGDDWGGPAAIRVWQGLSSVPPEDRDFVTIVTDRHGQPPMLAGHDATLDGVDAVDYYGLWKLSDGLFACAFRGQWCEYALGNTPEQRSMGTWSDGVPVTDAQITDDPGPPATPSPAG